MSTAILRSTRWIEGLQLTCLLYTSDPAYLNYTLGKLMIRKLRADWIAKTGGGAAPAAAGDGAAAGDDQSKWHDFHDKFLSYGGPPIPLLRKELVGDGGGLL